MATVLRGKLQQARPALMCLRTTPGLGAATTVWTHIWCRVSYSRTGSSALKIRGLKTWLPLRFICLEWKRRHGWKGSRLLLRRECLLALGVILLAGCKARHHRKVIVIGVDGMDPGFL